MVVTSLFVSGDSGWGNAVFSSPFLLFSSCFSPFPHKNVKICWWKIVFLWNAQNFVAFGLELLFAGCWTFLWYISFDERFFLASFCFRLWFQWMESIFALRNGFHVCSLFRSFLTPVFQTFLPEFFMGNLIQIVILSLFSIRTIWLVHSFNFGWVLIFSFVFLLVNNGFWWLLFQFYEFEFYLKFSSGKKI